jgi:hypothetical protein
MDFYDLINKLVNDIQHLESKVVYLRHSLSGYLPEHDGKMLKYEIFSDLVGSYCEQPAYQKYISECHGGNDPMDSDMYNDLLKRLSRGEDSVGL